MSETPANQFGISTDLSLFLWLHAPLCLSLSAAALFFKWMLLSPKKKRSKPSNLILQNSGNGIRNLAFNRPVLVLISASESFGLELLFCFQRHADYLNIQHFELSCWKLFTGYCDTLRTDDRHTICALGSSLLWVFPHLRVSTCLLVLLCLPIMHCAVLCSTSLSSFKLLTVFL